MKNLKTIYHEKIEKIYCDTMFYSNNEHILFHPDFSELINYGKKITPYIIEDLHTNPSWHHILILAKIEKEGLKEFNKSKIRSGKFKDHSDFWINWWKKEIRKKKLNRILKGT